MDRLRVSKTRLFISLAVLTGLFFVVFTQFGEAPRLWELLRNASVSWLLVALVLQVGTYVADGIKWQIATQKYGHRIPLKELSKIAVEQLSMNQFIPSVGMAGNAVVGREMLRIGIPMVVVMKAIAIDILSTLASYCVLTILLFFLLEINGLLSLYILLFLIAFFIFISLVTVAFWYLLRYHKKWRVLHWLRKFKPISNTLGFMSQIPNQEDISPKLFFQSTILRLFIILLDGVTLWTLMQAISTPVTQVSALMALILGSIGGIISFLPGGIGGFEAACAWILVLMGTDLEEAVAGTLLLRAFVLWLPLIPGLIFMRRDLLPITISETQQEV